MPSEQHVAVGRVGRPHGVRGEVRVDPMGGLPEGLRGYTRFYLGRGDEPRPVDIEHHRVHGRFLVVKFAGCHSPEAARSWTHSTLYVDRSEMPALAEDEYYHVDLPGCRVIDEKGQCLGRVVDVLPAGGHDVLVVAKSGREWMLPVVSEYVLSMDLDRDTIVAQVPQGL